MTCFTGHLPLPLRGTDAARRLLIGIAAILALPEATVASTSTVLYDCFKYNDTGYRLEIEYLYRNIDGNEMYMPVSFYPGGDFCPGTKIEYEQPQPRIVMLKGVGSQATYYDYMGARGETTFIEMAEGSVVSMDCFEGNPQVFQHIPSPYSWPLDVTSDYDITVGLGKRKQKTIYLGFRTESEYYRYTYAIGWIAIQVDISGPYTRLDVIASAMDAAGGSLTVGNNSDRLAGGVRQTDIYVDASALWSGDGCSWESPFRSIQEGVDAVRLDGTVVHVKPGVYMPVQVNNRKFTLNGQTCSFKVESTDGPHLTIIQGLAFMEGLRPTYSCFWYGENPVDLYDTVRGFTLCGAIHGGERGRFEDCIISNCCIGLCNATAVNCLIMDNVNDGMNGGEMYNCVSTRNDYGMKYATACNSILMGNTTANRDSGACYSCCITPMPTVGTGNITNDPLFVDTNAKDFRLRWNSPCIDAGNDGKCQMTTDMAGNRRMQGSHVDMGCYEHGAGTNGTTATTPVAVPHEWLNSHVPDMVADAGGDCEVAAMGTSGKRDASGAPLALWQEFVQGTDPADSNDCFRVDISCTGKVGLSFAPCLPDRRYTLYGSMLPTGPWSATTNFNDDAFLSTNRFFKVCVGLR